MKPLRGLVVGVMYSPRANRFNGKKYASTTLNGNKKSAEHAAALVAILDQGL